jgi:hypothetical protein
MKISTVFAWFFLFLAFGNLPALAQFPVSATSDTLVLGRSKFPKGVYKTKEEFLARKPSYVKPLVLKKTSLEDDVFSHGRSGDVRLEGIDSMSRKKIRKKVFAYCSGDKLYVNTRLMGRKYGFREVRNNGPIWYVQAQDENGYVPGGLIGYGLVHSDPENFHRIEGLYFAENDFKIYRLQGFMLEKLLADNPELLAKYKAEPKVKGNELKELQAKAYLDELNALK